LRHGTGAHGPRGQHLHQRIRPLAPPIQRAGGVGRQATAPPERPCRSEPWNAAPFLVPAGAFGPVPIGALQRVGAVFDGGTRGCASPTRCARRWLPSCIPPSGSCSSRWSGPAMERVRPVPAGCQGPGRGGACADGTAGLAGPPIGHPGPGERGAAQTAGPARAAGSALAGSADPL
jgi:hypothetical protein